MNSFEDMSAAQLYITMKDHRLAEPLQKMILNRMRMVRQSALEEGIELDDIPVDQTIKPVNIYISQTFDSSCRDEIVKELPCLRQFDVDYNLEATESPGKEYFS